MKKSALAQNAPPQADGRAVVQSGVHVEQTSTSIDLVKVHKIPGHRSVLINESTERTVRRNSSTLPIKGYIVANLDPAKKQLPTLQVRHGVLVCVTACHVEVVGSIPVMFHYTKKKIFISFFPVVLFLILNSYAQQAIKTGKQCNICRYHIMVCIQFKSQILL